MLKVIIVDDEINALEMMHLLLSSIDGVEVINQFTSAQHALSYAKKHSFDAIFLDIDMPNLNGLELAFQLKKINPNIQTVFVTAYRDFAVEAFELNSVDYILKPVIKNRIIESVNRLKSLSKTNKSPYIQCFSSFQAYNEKGQTLKWRTAKEKELWAYFIVSQGRYLERDKIIEDIWGSVPYEKGKIYLHTCLSYLRKDLQKLSLNKNIIVKENNGYRLNIEDLKCDYYEYLKLCNTLSSASIKNLVKATELYKTGLLTNESYLWCQSKTLETEITYIDALNFVIDYYTSCNNFSLVKAYLKKALAVQPYSDNICIKLMKAYLKLEERTAAIALYNVFAQRLQQELQINPQLETTQVYLQIRGS